MRESAVHFSPTGGSERWPDGKPIRLSYTVPEAAELLSIGERSLWKLIKAGVIASFRTDAGRSARRLISYRALENYIAEREKAEQQIAA